MKKELIEERILKFANWAKSIASTATDIRLQLERQVTSSPSEFFYYGLLKRQSNTLNDINVILVSSHKDQLGSVFILLRCLLDDFILLNYLDSKNFEEDLLIHHCASAHEQNLETIRLSMQINNKHFNGTNRGMIATADYKVETAKFFTNPQNEIYFKTKRKNEKERSFKEFPSAKEMINSLSTAEEDNQRSQATANALIRWKEYSHFVHYSNISNEMENGKMKYFEIIKIQEALSFCYKSVAIISKVFKIHFNRQHSFKDPDDIIESLMEDHYDLKNI